MVKENSKKKEQRFSENSENRQKNMNRQKELVTSWHLKARSSHMKKGNDHMCYINEIMYKWIRSDRFEKHFRARFDKTQ